MMDPLEVEAPDPNDDFATARDRLIFEVDRILEERPELRPQLTPDDGTHAEARQLRVTCQAVLDLLSEVSDCIPEQTYVQASDMLMKLFSLASPRESQSKLIFVGHTLFAAFQQQAIDADIQRMRVTVLKDREVELRKEIAKLRREALETHTARAKDAQRVKRLVKLNVQAAEAHVRLEAQADALRRHKKRFR